MSQIQIQNLKLYLQISHRSNNFFKSFLGHNMNLDPLLNIYFPKHCFYWFLSFSWTFHPSLALSIHLREGLAARSEGGGCAVWCVSDDAYSVGSQPVPSCPLATMVWQ